MGVGLWESCTVALLAILFLLGEQGHQGQSAGGKAAAIRLEFTPTAAARDTTVLTQGEQGYQPRQQHQAQSEESKGHWPPNGR